MHPTKKILRWSHISEGWVNSARSGPLLTSSTKSVGGLPKRKPEPSKERAGPWPLVLGHDYLVKCRLWGFAPKLPSFNCLTEDRALLLRGFMTVSLSSSRHPAQVLPLCLSSPSFHSLLPRNQWYLIDNRLNLNEKLYIDNNSALACHPFPFDSPLPRLWQLCSVFSQSSTVIDIACGGVRYQENLCRVRISWPGLVKKKLFIFIGPESDHWECLSVTHSLTDSLTAV